MQSLTSHFKVHTFEGPLDLLLQLIEEKRLPITEISLAEVTEQFLQTLRLMEGRHPEILADFLLVAGKLLVIKSRSLLPQAFTDKEIEQTSDLTQSLLVLKKYREAARYLRALDLRRRQSFTREPAAFEERFFYPDPAI